MQMGHWKLFRWEVWHDEEAWLDFPAWLFPHSNYGFIKSIISPKQKKKKKILRECYYGKLHFISHRSYRKITSAFCFYSILEYFHRIYVKKFGQIVKILQLNEGKQKHIYIHNVEWEGWNWGFEKSKILGFSETIFSFKNRFLTFCSDP